ncbi:hypothetical protein Vadar_013459 [Vaccinium darrowii]|uniref:Uncharacterized protein n=1 Tax=Vaccinium darrowii TaxID=229202 RepID=A0ACB7ZBJ2_9ERIC|nr:hypothetical protein Vadar_013459 [Vaccinium darrowii]
MADFGFLDLEEGFGDTEVNNSRCLVGKVIQGRNIRAPILADILKSAWRTRAPFHVDEWNNNVFLFRFENMEDRSNIIQEGPWSVMNNLLVLIPLMDGMVVSELNFNLCPFWVQIHGLPVEKLNRANAEIVGNRLGKLMALEAATDGLCLTRGFLRVRVEINIEQPLIKGFWLRGKTESNRDRWISFKYEKLPDFCYDCGRLGHDYKGCHFVSKSEGENSGYGPGLRTGRPRKGVTPIEIIQTEATATEPRAHNLRMQRPEIDVHDTGARGINDRDERVTDPGHATALQEFGAVETRPSSSNRVLQRPGVDEIRGPSINPVTQGNIPLLFSGTLTLPTPNGSGLCPIEPLLPNSPISKAPINNSTQAQYYVTEPDSPKAHCFISPISTLSTQPNPIPDLLTQLPHQVSPNNPPSQLLESPIENSTQICLTHLPHPVLPTPNHPQVLDNPVDNLILPNSLHKINHPPISPINSSVIKPRLNSPLNSTSTTPTLSSKDQIRPISPQSRDTSISTVFKSLSLKRKLEEDDPSPTHSKILRLCSPTTAIPPFSPPTKSNSVVGKLRKHNPRTRSPSRKLTSQDASLFSEEGLCEVQVRQWLKNTGDSNKLPLIDLDVSSMVVDGRVAGPKQPHSQC